MLFLFQKQTLVGNDFAYSSFRGKVNNIFLHSHNSNNLYFL
jgi:hypothetical protein